MGEAQTPEPSNNKLQRRESSDENRKREPDSAKNAGDVLVDLMGRAGLAGITLNPALRVVDWNPGVERLLGCSAEEICGQPLSDLITDEKEKNALSDYLGGVRDNSDGVTIPVTRVQRRGGEEGIFCEWRGAPVFHPNGEVSFVQVVVKDVTPEVESRNAFNRLEKETSEILESAPIGIYQADNEGRLLMANPEMAWMLGYESAEALVAEVNDIAIQVFAETEKAEEFLFELYEAEQLNRFRSTLRKRNGATFWALSYAQTVRNNGGRICGFYGFAIDISHTVRTEDALKQVNEELRLSSIQDGLTKIPNRRRFDEVLKVEWRRLFRERQVLSVIICDIDFFKLYNDSYGHQSGDTCLQSVARTIAATLKRPSDLAARYGGEEFALVLPNTDVAGALHVAEEVRKAVRDLEIPHKASKIDTCITLSLGVGGWVPGPDSSPDELLRSADKALYAAKEQGRNRCVGPS